MPEKSVEQASVARPNESLVCDNCGHFGAVEIGERVMCPDCYSQNCASCCPEFGREESPSGRNNPIKP
jgi:hypothetical protein